MNQDWQKFKTYQYLHSMWRYIYMHHIQELIFAEPFSEIHVFLEILFFNFSIRCTLSYVDLHCISFMSTEYKIDVPTYFIYLTKYAFLKTRINLQKLFFLIFFFHYHIIAVWFRLAFLTSIHDTCRAILLYLHEVKTLNTGFFLYSFILTVQR